MIKIETTDCEDSNLQITGNRHVLCLETLLIIVKEVQAGILRKEDKEIIKTALDMDSKMMNEIEQEVKNALSGD